MTTDAQGRMDCHYLMTKLAIFFFKFFDDTTTRLEPLSHEKYVGIFFLSQKLGNGHKIGQLLSSDENMWKLINGL